MVAADPVSKEAVDRLISEHVLVLVPGLLGDEDPMPLYALKLLGALLDSDRDHAWVREVQRWAPEFCIKPVLFLAVFSRLHHLL